MVESFVFYVRDPKSEVSHPILCFTMPLEIYKFFEENEFADKTKGEAFMEWVIEKLQKRGVSLPAGYEYFVNLLSVAIYCKHNVDILPVINLP